MSITTVICHTGIQYSSHVQVKPFFLSAPPITMRERGAKRESEGEGERESSKGVGMTGDRKRKRERGFEIERALLQSSPWVGDEEIYRGTQGLINAAGIALTPAPPSYTHSHTHTPC